MHRTTKETYSLRVHWLLPFLLLPSVAAAPAWAYALYLSASRNTAALPIAMLALVGLNGLLIRQLVRSQPVFGRLIRIGFLFKALAVACFMIVLLAVYRGGDALLYHLKATILADHFWEFGQLPDLFSEGGTDFVNRLTGTIYIVLGKSFASGMLLFGCLGYWGCYFYLRTFQRMFPTRNLSVTAVMLFFFPSLVFWTASVGKDAIVLFSSGLLCYGASRLLTGGGWAGATLTALGLVGTGFARPHIALMLLLAAVVSFTFSRSSPLLSHNVTRMLGILLFIPALLLLAPLVQRYIGLEELSLGSSVDYLEHRLLVTTSGGSSFGAASFLRRLLFAPLLLIRPLPWEAHNLTSAIAAAEGILFLVVLIVFRKNFIANLLRVRRNPLLLFILLFVIEFLLIFSSIGNFGILARQRVMVFPLLFLFFSAPAETSNELESPASYPPGAQAPSSPTTEASFSSEEQASASRARA